MINVLARKALQFRNPNVALVNKQAKLGESDQVKMSTKLDEAFCRVAPNQVTSVPDWVKTDPIFGWCVDEGTLMEIAPQAGAAKAGAKTPADLNAQAQQQQADAKKAADAKKLTDEEKALAEKLSKMSKKELLEYATETHDLELSQGMSRENILNAINEAEAEQEKEGKA